MAASMLMLLPSKWVEPAVPVDDATAITVADGVAVGRTSELPWTLVRLLIEFMTGYYSALPKTKEPLSETDGSYKRGLAWRIHSLD